MASRLRASFADLKLDLVPVSPVDLRERFAGIGNGVKQPDLLLSGTAIRDKNPFLADLSLTSLGTEPEGMLPWGSDLQPWNPRYRHDWLILSSATHPDVARAFVVWLEDGMRAHAELRPLGGPVRGPSSLALSVAQSALSGGQIGSADPDAAKVPVAILQGAAFHPAAPDALDGVAVKVDVLAWAANERFAVYGLRAIASSPRAFGVAHPLLILRRGEDGNWRVLQMSANLAADRLSDSFGMLWPYARAVRPELVKAVVGVTLAAPVDGDIRSGMPELWWDNAGDARLLAVEWQLSSRDTHLFLVQDDGPRLQVRVRATFAEVPGAYRWRVWSLGAGGTMNLSPWRQVTVLP